MSRPLALITGASSGLGEIFARKLAADHDLILVARRQERLEALAVELAGAHGGSVEVLAADLAGEAGLKKVEERVSGEERLVLLVNNAGFGTRGLFWTVSLESQETMHALHVRATMRLCRAALAAMVPRNRGAIVNVASVAAFLRSPGLASYGATKSWMTVFTEALHLELRAVGSKVQVQALCPGYTRTEFHQAMGVSRESSAARWLWMDPAEVVGASLAGLKRRKLFVIPGWRYRMVVALVTKLPVRLRLALESATARKRPL